MEPVEPVEPPVESPVEPMEQEVETKPSTQKWYVIHVYSVLEKIVS